MNSDKNIKWKEMKSNPWTIKTQFVVCCTLYIYVASQVSNESMTQNPTVQNQIHYVGVKHD